ncbi:MAG: DUF5659 domain-containing protein [Candidatus Magasanikbacteria bacterium]
MKTGLELNKQLLEEQPKIFTTSDLGCAAALVTVGLELVSLDKTNSRRVLFGFREGVEVEEAFGAYFCDKMNVGARAYFDNIKMLKNRIYSSKS